MENEGIEYIDIDNKEEVLFNLELQLDDDNTANIVIRENDNIDEVVDKFCEEHELDESVKQVIMDQVVDSLDQNIQACTIDI